MNPDDEYGRSRLSTEVVEPRDKQVRELLKERRRNMELRDKVSEEIQRVREENRELAAQLGEEQIREPY